MKRLVFFGWPLVKGLGCACYFGAIRQKVFRDVVSGDKNNMETVAYVQRYQVVAIEMNGNNNRNYIPP